MRGFLIGVSCRCDLSGDERDGVLDVVDGEERLAEAWVAGDDREVAYVDRVAMGQGLRRDEQEDNFCRVRAAKIEAARAEAKDRDFVSELVNEAVGHGDVAAEVSRAFGLTAEDGLEEDGAVLVGKLTLVDQKIEKFVDGVDLGLGAHLRQDEPASNERQQVHAVSAECPDSPESESIMRFTLPRRRTRSNQTAGVGCGGQGLAARH